jgi:hypothetical protein
MDVAEVQKTIDQAQEKGVEKTPEKVVVSGVIGGQANQDVHDKAHAASHTNDKTLSEPDMIAMEENETVAAYKARVAQIQANRFGFYDSEEEKPIDVGASVAGKTKIHEHPAKQALEPIPELSPTMREAPFDSSVKANVQITNVPEVSEAVTEEVLGKYAEAVLENAADAVRQIENHLMTPNAINSDFQKLGQWAVGMPGHFAQSADQLNKDVQAIIDSTAAQIDKPLEPEDRAKMAGTILPIFFFEGGSEPINPETINQMGLEGLSEAELKALGIEKRVEFAEERIAGNRSVLEEKDIVNPVDRNATTEKKLAQLRELSEENVWLAKKFLGEIDTKFGTTSEIGIKKPQDILEKANRASIKESKEWFDVEHVRDSFRFKTPVENLNDLPRIVEQLKESGFEIVKLDLDKLIKPKGRGWQVAVIDLRAPNGQLVEWQILSREMNEAGKIEHKIYKQWRGKDLSAMSMAEKDLKREVDAQAVDLYKSAWREYLKRTGQTESAVMEIIQQTKRLLLWE